MQCVLNSGLVQSSVVYYTACPNKSDGTLFFLKQQQSQAFIGHQAKPKSQNREGHRKEKNEST